MCLRFVFLLITRVAAWLRLSCREEAWRTAEILVLRHQVAVLQRQPLHRQKLNWADRALFAALLGLIPKARCNGLRLLVTPDTIPSLAPRYHPSPVGGKVHARQGRPPGDPPERQSPGVPAGPGEPRVGDTGGSTGNWPAWE